MRNVEIVLEKNETGQEKVTTEDVVQAVELTRTCEGNSKPAIAEALGKGRASPGTEAERGGVLAMRKPKTKTSRAVNHSTVPPWGKTEKG